MGVAEAEKTTSKRRNNRTTKKRFLELLAAGNHVAYSCQEAGIGRTTVYRWRDEDGDFAAAWEEAELASKENLERIAYKRASESSDNLLMFLLKRRDPAYRDSHQIQLEHTGKVEHEHKVVSAVAVLNILQDAGAFDGFEDRPGGALAGSRELLAAHTNGEAGGLPPASTS